MKKIKLLFICSFILTSSTVFAQATIPYFDDFEGANAGWTVDSVSGSTWELGLPTTAPTNSVHSGIKAWDVDLNNPYLANTECYLISPPFDFSSPANYNAILSFWQNRSTEVGWDGARMDYSTNNGVSWQVLGSMNYTGAINWYTNGGIGSSGLSAWDGNSNGWIKSSFPLTIMNGLNNVLFRFAFSSDVDVEVAGFTMDDFSITLPLPFDAGVSAILEPNANSLANSISPINVVITNFGTNNLNSFPVEAVVNGGSSISFTWSGLLAPGASTTVTVGTLTIPAGLYDICAYTGLINDGDLSNDTLCSSLNGSFPGILVSVFDSLGFTNCMNPPILDQFYISGTTSGLNNGDTVTVQLAFGDGTDTTVATIVNNNAYFALVYHWYLFCGQFSVQAIASSTTGLTDTATGYNQLIISDTCGNISGNVFADLNNNCMFDGSDYQLGNISVYLMQGGTITSTYYTTANGDYFFIVPAASVYDVTIDTSYAGNNTYCPVGGKITGITEPSSENNFAISPDNNFDLEPFINTFTISANAGTPLYVSMQNHFLNPVSGSYKLVLDTNLLLVTSASPAPSFVNGDTLVWNVNAIGNYNSNGFYASLIVFPKNNLVIGSSICFTAISEPVSGDYIPSNNTRIFCGTVSNSSDPNNKTVEPTGIGATGNVGPATSSFTYTVNFQNTGTAPAYNVFILDTIDYNLDIATLHVLQSSHLMTTQIIASNVVKFSFNNIFLPDSTSDEPGSHGFVSYTICPKSGLADGTQIKNTGHIYFDFNSAIVTNTSTNTIDYSLGMTEINKKQVRFTVYPNPASDYITIFINDEFKGEMIVSDVYGKKVLTKKANRGIQQFNLENISCGFYTITLKSDSYFISEKILIAR